ncbi:hypothetical protein SAY86_005871 [Trapa natans]|uniref:Uncharacterized protein n=1 Tax=Trapa natans TaxID=22666 RepID=A0AAN7QVY3_TRANT|nr:hypothetical protein SAY86_005871 [Trapa natans]
MIGREGDGDAYTVEDGAGVTTVGGDDLVSSETAVDPTASHFGVGSSQRQLEAPVSSPSRYSLTSWSILVKLLSIVSLSPLNLLLRQPSNLLIHVLCLHLTVRLPLIIIRPSEIRNEFWD